LAHRIDLHDYRMAVTDHINVALFQLKLFYESPSNRTLNEFNARCHAKPTYEILLAMHTRLTSSPSITESLDAKISQLPALEAIEAFHRFELNIVDQLFQLVLLFAHCESFLHKEPNSPHFNTTKRHIQSIAAVISTARDRLIANRTVELTDNCIAELNVGDFNDALENFQHIPGKTAAIEGILRSAYDCSIEQTTTFGNFLSALDNCTLQFTGYTTVYRLYTTERCDHSRLIYTEDMVRKMKEACPEWKHGLYMLSLYAREQKAETLDSTPNADVMVTTSNVAKNFYRQWQQFLFAVIVVWRSCA